MTTGVDNKLLLANLERAALKFDIWLCVPLIADFNDSEEHILFIVDLMERLKIKKISVLPYHEGGTGKCEQLGRSYPMEGTRAPDDNKNNMIKSLAE